MTLLDVPAVAPPAPVWAAPRRAPLVLQVAPVLQTDEGTAGMLLEVHRVGDPPGVWHVWRGLWSATVQAAVVGTNQHLHDVHEQDRFDAARIVHLLAATPGITYPEA